MVLKAEINFFPFQPAGVAPVEHRAPSEGGGCQQAGQADALQVGDDTDFNVGVTYKLYKQTSCVF